MKPENIYIVPLDYIRDRRSSNQVGDKSWEVREYIQVTLSSGEDILIPGGFQTDLSSVPEFLWGFMKPFGDFIIAALVHDWMYVNNYREEELGTYKARLFADKEMLIISEKINRRKRINRVDNWVRYYGVRLFGGWKY